MNLKRLPRLNLELGILLAVLALTAAHYCLHRAFTVDDAAISFSYAGNLAEGFGLGALYPGAPRVEGYSNLLWVVLLGAGSWLGFETVYVSKVLGLVFALGCPVVLYLILKDFLHQKWMLAGLALLAFSLPFIFWSVSGLENALYAFLLLLSVYFLLLEGRDPQRMPFASALTLLLVSMTRPEGLVYALAGFAYKFVQLAIAWFTGDRGVKRSYLRQVLVWLAVFTIGYGIFKAWHVWYFAYLWPNPVYAKAGWDSKALAQVWAQPEGWVYLRGFFRTFGAVYLIPFSILGGLVALSSELRVLVFFALAALVLPLYTHDWMVNYRFVVPFIPFYVALLILAADRLWSWSLGASGNRFTLRAAALVAGVIFTFILARSTWANLRLAQNQLDCGYQEPWGEARCIGDRNYWTMAEVSQNYADLDAYAARIGIADPLYLIPDIGATSYVHDYRIVDLAGLADVHLARADNSQIIKQYLFEEQQPDFLLTHSVWTRRTDLTAFDALWDNYLPVDTNEDRQGHIHGTFVRRDLVVDPSRPIAGTSQELAPGLFLSAIDAPTPVRPGTSIPINCYWYRTEAQLQALQQRTRLVDPSGMAVYDQTDPLGYGWYPTTSWGAGEVIRQHITLPDNLPEGNYQLELSIVDADGDALASTAAWHTLNIDQVAARKHAQDLVIEAQELFNQGDPPAAVSTLEMADTVYPGLPGVKELMVQYRSEASQRLLVDAQTSSQDGEYEELLIAAQEYARLRGRQQALPAWAAFSAELENTAYDTQKRGDEESAYILFLAATLADPDASSAGRGLEQARRLYLDGMQDEISRAPKTDL